MILPFEPALPKKHSQVQGSKFILAESSYGIAKRLQVVEEWLNFVKEKTAKSCLDILDFGCGTGELLTYPLACNGDQVLGVDIHEASIAQARGRYALPNLRFRTGNLEALWEERLTFDVIICSEVLEHQPTPPEFLRLLRRLLRNEGALIITTPNGYGSYEMLCRLERGLRRIGVHQSLGWVFRRSCSLIRLVSRQKMDSSAAQAVPADQAPGFLNAESVHVQFFRLQVLEQLFRKSGFRIVSRRARTFLCGPYVDVLFNICPFRQTLFRINSRLADLLPFSWAADWMFLLEPDRHTQS